jgi:hypothetical protein
MKSVKINSGARILSVISLSVMSSCGSLKDAKKDDLTNQATAPKPVTAAKEATFQLRGASLLAQQSESSFGPKMDLVDSATKAQNGSTVKESIFTKYQNNFGTEAGLKIQDKFADAPTESYFLALAIAGDAIARNCEIDVTTKAAASKCFCATDAAAKEMLQRSLVRADFNAPEKAEFITKFSQGCKASYRATIGGLINSLAFVQR